MGLAARPALEECSARTARGAWSDKWGINGFKYFLFSPLFGEDSQFDEYFFKGVETTN